MNFKKKISETSPGFQMAPMIDIIFILLIHFMVATIFAQWENKLGITVPTADSGTRVERQQGELIINIDSEGRIYVNSLEKSLEFYCDILGLRIVDEVDILGKKFYFVGNDDFSIEIFTVTGKLVKVIDLAELGGIHIGRNITDYAWDGTDMYGDRLANGVYFYRVKARINRQSVDHRQSGADAYWKHETGKMYLLR